MIRLTPYYNREDSQEIFEIYLGMAVKALPFYKEDVLKSGADPTRKRPQAERAEQYVYNYSPELHWFLYREKDVRLTKGRVNQVHLRGLLEMKLPEFSDKQIDSDVPEAIASLIDAVRRGTKLERVRRGIYALVAELLEQEPSGTALTDCTDLEDGYQMWLRAFRLTKTNLSKFRDEFQLNAELDGKQEIQLQELLDITVRKYSDGAAVPDDDFKVRLQERAAALLGELIDKQAGTELLERVFCYDKFSKEADAYKLAAKLGAEVCPYCNRLFTTTLPPAKVKTADGGEKKMSGIRPQFDHYKSKSRYPFLALSINNLIPCCGVCNLTKHDSDEDILYPYGEGMGDDCIFVAEPIQGDITAMLQGARIAPETFEIRLVPKENSDTDRNNRIKASIESLRLEELYQVHKGYVADVFFQRYIVTDDYVELIKEQFPHLFPTVQDVWNALFLMDTSFEKWGDRPLTKLTHDIKKEIDELYVHVRSLKQHGG